MACGDWCADNLFTYRFILLFIFFFFVFSAGKSRPIDNDNSLVKVALSMAKIIVSSSGQRFSERSLSHPEDFLGKVN